ncbi:MAG: hypothetical protein M3307_04015 [Thermoproteota archaeon]|nr:hypothetical protein [Thermoproteota archaeon]MDQ3727384.1 hypothetical protein [Thermoproteota archaeon]MDQ5859814.1 hypothetical protein [Thermoproteota archaeon]
MVVEEILYDFGEFPGYADDFVRNLLNLMIISKMNAAIKNLISKNYFVHLISQIDGCEAYVVKYGQPLLYVKYYGMEFTDQKVTTQFVRSKDHIISVTMESIFGEFVKSFDSLASMTKTKVKWGIMKEKEDKPDPLFALLDSFVGAVIRLTSLDPSNPDSLADKRFGIRNASVIRKSLHLEFLINSNLNIIELNPREKRKDDAIKLLFSRSEAAKAIVSLMKQ